MKKSRSAQNSNTKGRAADTANPYFLRPAEAAVFLGVSKRTLSNLQKRRAIGFTKLGRAVIFKREDILAAVEKFRIAPVGELSE